ncbi:tetratricopeptide repeat protein [Methanospirillum hungatei]|uniref:tetratricopeptide repeat protein n=1 Tax=Methanospirillum hungatei TaxID=2203 RepID=UPI0026F28495|nr:tetratricopeptide repeat protein [Methanospirillum hungatei]MCA1917194.1 tetratricopeptide repeat protein [Methanospirillum hungatei]
MNTKIGYYYMLMVLFTLIFLFPCISADTPHTAQEWIDIAYDRFSDKDYSGTIDAADKAIQIDPSLERAWNIKSAALRNLKQFDDALKAAEEAIALNNSYSAPWYNKAESLMNLGQEEDALLAYERATELNDKHVSSWVGKSWALNTLGYFEKGLEAADKAIALDPNNEFAWNNKGLALKLMGNYEKAKEAYEMVLQLNPLNTNALSQLQNLSITDQIKDSPTESINQKYQVYKGSLFTVEYPKSAQITGSESSIKFKGDNPPFSMTVGLVQRSVSYSSLDDFIDSWTRSFALIYDISNISDVFVGEIPAKQFTIKNKDGEVVMISTIFWENNIPNIISNGGGSELLTEEEQHFLKTYKNIGIPGEEIRDPFLNNKKIFSDSKYTFEYPEEWSLSIGNDSEFTFDVPDRNVKINGYYIETPVDFSQYMEVFKQKMDKGFKDFKIIKDTPGVSKEGYPTRIVEFSCIYNGAITNTRTYVLSANNTFYFLIITYRTNESSDIRELTDEIFTSYMITK